MVNTHASLFSGIGGFDLAAEWAGYKNEFHCEINTFGQIILNYYWPQSKLYKDVTTADFKPFRNKIKVLSGGFPCQDNSNANQSSTRKQGLRGARTGLFFQMCRAIEEIGPQYVIAENVADLLTVNGGEDFGTILTELSSMGYNAEWRICRSSDVGAPTIEKGCILLLTPTTSDYKRDRLSFPMYTRRHHRSPGCLPEHLYKLIGAVPGHLSHLFLAWMMGFPLQWLDLQRHNGVKNKSKPLGMR